METPYVLPSTSPEAWLMKVPSVLKRTPVAALWPDDVNDPALVSVAPGCPWMTTASPAPDTIEVPAATS